MRLWKLVTLSLDQQHIVEDLWTQERGICTCGRAILKMDAKLCMSYINTSWAALPGVRNTMAIGIYCGFCAQIINMTLKSLKKLPEPDKLKRQTLSDENG